MPSYLRPEVMLIKHSRSNKPLLIMDPDCAICNQPAVAQCECEAKGLDIAVRQAEHRIMTSVFNDIRAWVRGHAQDYILEYFSVLTTRRKDAHASRIHALTEHAHYYYRSHPHLSEIAAADAELKRGIDDDWKASVQRYPEVLEYFYGLVDLNLPSDNDPAVKDPPLSALAGASRKVRLREPERRRARRTTVVMGQGPPGPPPLGRRASAPYGVGPGIPGGYGYVQPGY